MRNARCGMEPVVAARPAPVGRSSAGAGLRKDAGRHRWRHRPRRTRRWPRRVAHRGLEVRFVEHDLLAELHAAAMIGDGGRR